MPEISFNELSYDRHKGHLDNYVVEEDKILHAAYWKRKDTVTAWLYDLMLSNMDPLLDSAPGSTWLTVGDGLYGYEANYIQGRGGTALATDLSAELLIQARSEGFIKAFKSENAERLSFRDDSFDFAISKEAFHHFPRPMVAFYEMLRVARMAVAYIEPLEQGRDEYEGVGNYVYCLSPRELTRAALAMNLPGVAFRLFNSHYEYGLEYELAIPGSKPFETAKLTLEAKNRLSGQNGMYEMVSAVVFKCRPPLRMVRALEAKGYNVIMFKANPYANGPLPKDTYPLVPRP